MVGSLTSKFPSVTLKSDVLLRRYEEVFSFHGHFSTDQEERFKVSHLGMPPKFLVQDSRKREKVKSKNNATNAKSRASILRPLEAETALEFSSVKVFCWEGKRLVD